MSDATTPAQQDPMFAGWDGLDWQERRGRRFERWLAARGVEFQSETARRDYQERVQLFVDALELRKPARVPLCVQAQYFVARYSGLTIKQAMTDYEGVAAALTKYYEDFRPDSQGGPGAPARVFELLGLQFVNWPGRGLGDETPWQYLEGEYMKADEYDALIANPEVYFRRAFLPRVGSAFAPLAALDPMTDMSEATTMLFSILPFGDAAVVEGLQRLADAARECRTYLTVTGEANVDAAARLGIPPRGGGIVKAPYDVLADTLRGTRGIMIDRFRQPDKILEACERLVPLMIEWGVRQADRAEAPLVTFVLHKGADGFMSDSDFRTFYWPTLKAVMKGMIDQGVVPAMFAEGGYNKRLAVIADDEIPAGSTLWMFDQTDMAAAKNALRGYACIAGNVPTALLALAGPAEVEDYVTQLLDTCATDGGYILQSGAVLDDAKAENVKAMIETGRNWRG
jgi:hypothetical protein